ncbi:MAG: molybdenum cofactor guanylyltransferase [Nitrososphaerota archaeon]|nr:molybdenum cofactor guanylyltransferase [Candidatus Bathyarchaeota archaeon]MDW8061792.1 molybdenum cofactor guanylyltransferase [Nitrososphaerota archaeon]
MADLSSIILAGGSSRRFGRSKALVEILGKPMLGYVYDAASSISDEVLIVVSRDIDLSPIERIASGARIVVEDYEASGPLRAALEGWRNVRGGNSILLSCDIPLVSPELLSILSETMGSTFDAVIPRWPNGFIEPLYAAYKVKPAIEAAVKALELGENRFIDMIQKIKRKIYFSTVVVENILGSTDTFLNVNSIEDLRRAEGILRKNRKV